MKATFEHTVDVLVKAFLNNTLAHGTCAACAVGNIIADVKGTNPEKNHYSTNGFKFDRFENGDKALWYQVFITEKGKDQFTYPYNFNGDVKKQIESTGYSWEDLAKIEKAFETAPRNCHYEDGQNEEWMFNGLMAVVDVLADIHQIDLKQKESAKLLFVKA